MINVFYVGREYGMKAGGRIGAYYEITDKGFRRTDIRFIEAALEKGESVCIRPATPKQLERIDGMLAKIILEDK